MWHSWSTDNDPYFWCLQEIMSQKAIGLRGTCSHSTGLDWKEGPFIVSWGWALSICLLLWICQAQPEYSQDYLIMIHMYIMLYWEWMLRGVEIRRIGCIDNVWSILEIYLHIIWSTFHRCDWGKLFTSFSPPPVSILSNLWERSTLQGGCFVEYQTKWLRKNSIESRSHWWLIHQSES